MMLLCDICNQPRESLIMDVCAKCDPELHTVWNAAVKSTVDYETVTPEISKAFALVQKRKLEGWGTDKPVGILSTDQLTRAPD